MSADEELSTRKLRGTISELLRQDFTDKLAELERLLNEAHDQLQAKEKNPPRSDFWDLRVLVPEENRGNYNRINPNETIGAIWHALKLEHVGKPEHMKLACRTYGSDYGIHLTNFDLQDFPEHMRIICNNFFNNNVVKFEFFMKPKRNEEETCDTTTMAEMMTALSQVYDSILEIDQTRLELLKKIDEYIKPLKEVLRKELETHADSGAEENHEEDDSDDDDSRAKNSRKRRKFGSNRRDTHQQQISLVGITLTNGTSVKNLRINEFRGNIDSHLMEIMGVLATGEMCIITKRLPNPRAPTYSDGAEMKLPNPRAPNEKLELEPPGRDVNSNTTVTQKMLDMDRENGTSLANEYELMHNLARGLNNKISDMVRIINNNLNFVVRVHTADQQYINYNVPNLTLMQRYAIGNLYLDSIAVNKDKQPEKAEADVDDDEEDDDDSNSDSNSDSNYNSSASSNEDADEDSSSEESSSEDESSEDESSEEEDE